MFPREYEVKEHENVIKLELENVLIKNIWDALNIKQQSTERGTQSL